MAEDTTFSQDLLPERVTSLVGQHIRIRGYILPSFQQTGLTQFVLVRDNMECCFGPGEVPKCITHSSTMTAAVWLPIFFILIIFLLFLERTLKFRCGHVKGLR